MGVYFRGQNGFMSQHFLHRPQVSTPVDQFGSKGMPECMWTDIFLYSCCCDEVLDHGKNHDPGQPAAPPVQEEYIFMIPLDFGQGIAVRQVVPDLLQRNPSNRHQPFLVAFSCDPDKFLVKVDVGQPQFR